MSSAVIIPARYGSKRFPGKPLADIAGKTLLQRVCEVARKSKAKNVFVATDDHRIFNHAEQLDVKAIMTPVECSTGTDRILAAIEKLEYKPTSIINLQGDAPLTNPQLIDEMIDKLESNACQVVTPAIRLSWQQLKELQTIKQLNPFSGTLVTIDANGKALWFSKNIIPAIRNTEQGELSPVYKHIGLYGYTISALQKFCNLPQTNYEKLEGLEQLRFLENGIAIQVITSTISEHIGVDTIHDAEMVASLINKQQEYS